jgi:hypothetical protein
MNMPKHLFRYRWQRRDYVFNAEIGPFSKIVYYQEHLWVEVITKMYGGGQVAERPSCFF